MKTLLANCVLASILFIPAAAFAVTKPVILQVIEKNLTVNGKQSKVFDIVQPDGTFGYSGVKGQLFDVTVQNKTHVSLVLHWHGIIDPNDQDGVPYVTQLPIAPGKSYHYQFILKQAGTYWFHSHYKLQEQKLMAAPLIIRDPDAPKEKEALMFIQDFTYQDPRLIYGKLRGKLQQSIPSSASSQSMGGMQMNGSMSGMQMGSSMMPGMQMDKESNSMAGMSMDVSDVKFDAYLTNHRTLQHPDIVKVTPKETVRLRIINASASSNYYIDLGKLKGELVAIDGEAIKPIQGSRFQVAIGNRLDIRVNIPAGENAYPILALPEGTRQQTGMILATPHAKIPTLSEKTKQSNALLDYSQEFKAFASDPMPAHAVQQSFPYILKGDMSTYQWTLNGQEWPNVTPIIVKPNQRTEFVFVNKSGMSHPMHIHGHTFQLTEIDGKPIQGRKGDTVNVMPFSTVKFVFDTTNRGIWMLHCHILYHQMGGMMTTFNYEGYPDKFTLQQREQGEQLYDPPALPNKKAKH